MPLVTCKRSNGQCARSLTRGGVGPAFCRFPCGQAPTVKKPTRAASRHFTPTSASWLNQVERWFAALTEKYLRRGTHRSTRQLEDAIRHYVDIYNANPKPFIWSKSADEILASLERLCVRVRKVAAGAS